MLERGDDCADEMEELASVGRMAETSSEADS